MPVDSESVGLVNLYPRPGKLELVTPIFCTKLSAYYGPQTHQTVGTWCIVDIDPVGTVVRVEVFTPVLVKAAAATHDDWLTRSREVPSIESEETKSNIARQRGQKEDKRWRLGIPSKPVIEKPSQKASALVLSSDGIQSESEVGLVVWLGYDGRNRRESPRRKFEPNSPRCDLVYAYKVGSGKDKANTDKGGGKSDRNENHRPVLVRTISDFITTIYGARKK